MSVEKLKEIEREMRTKAVEWRTSGKEALSKALYEISAALLVEASAWDEAADSLSAVIKEWEEQKPVAWMTRESQFRLVHGGNCKGAVPVHQKMSNTATIPLYAAPPSPAVDKLVEAIALAYGYLWHVNNEPGTPCQYPPERAAYEARKVLRDLMTHEQRGKAIGQAREALAFYEQENKS